MVHVLDYSLVYLIIVLLGMTCRARAMAVYDPATLKYEEYVVEHELSATQAKNVALSIDIEQVHVPPACQPCTRFEKNYCLSGDFINDHCCCDKRYHEYLDFIPHTCYVGTVLCATIANDCNEYTRLRMCCCNRLLLQKWKDKSSAYSSSVRPANICLLLILLYIVNICL